MARAFYLDSSAALTLVLNQPGGKDLRRTLVGADTLVSSRLAEVETARALVRLRVLNELSRPAVRAAEASLNGLWARCFRWELTPEVCVLATQLAPNSILRSLDALHLATFVLARRSEPALEMLTTDKRLAEAAGEVG